MKIAAIGECMVEFAPNGHKAWKMGFAGDTFNTLWTLRGLLPDDALIDYVSAFGDDEFSRQQLAFFSSHEIGTADSPHFQGGRPGLYAVTLIGAERSFTYWRNDSVARRLADSPDSLSRSLNGCDLIYFSGISLAILSEKARQTLLTAIHIARQDGSCVAFDPNYRQRLWSEPAIAAQVITEAETLSDIVLPTFDDEHQLFGDVNQQATVHRLRALKARECIVKNGSKPALLSAAGKICEIPANSSAIAVDTSGAGDAFNGAYLAARLKDIEPVAAVEFAHRIASLTIGVHGALTPMKLLKDALR